MMRFVLVAAVLLTGYPGCDDGQPRSATPPDATQRQRPETTAPELPRGLGALGGLCHDAASGADPTVRCPTWLPGGRWGARELRSSRCEYLFDLNATASSIGGAYHALAGGRCGNFSLRTANERWPVVARRVRDLGLIGSKPLKPGERGNFKPQRLRLLRRATVAGRPALLLMAERYPSGGMHGGHLAAVWNQTGSGYALTLHFSEESATDARREAAVLRAADSMSLAGDGGR